MPGPKVWKDPVTWCGSRLLANANPSARSVPPYLRCTTGVGVTAGTGVDPAPVAGVAAAVASVTGALVGATAADEQPASVTIPTAPSAAPPDRLKNARRGTRPHGVRSRGGRWLMADLLLRPESDSS